MALRVTLDLSALASGLVDKNRALSRRLLLLVVFCLLQLSELVSPTTRSPTTWDGEPITSDLVQEFYKVWSEQSELV